MCQRKLHVQRRPLLQQCRQARRQEQGADGVGAGQAQFAFQPQVFTGQGPCQLPGLLLHGVRGVEHAFTQARQFDLIGAPDE